MKTMTVQLHFGVVHIWCSTVSFDEIPESENCQFSVLLWSASTDAMPSLAWACRLFVQL